MGKPVHLTGNGANAIDPWTIVPIWFTAANIAHLIVIDAQRLGAGRVADIVSLACETNTTVWFFTHDTLRGPWQAGLVDWPVERLGWDTARAQLPEPQHRDRATVPEPLYSFGDLPAADMWTFRAECVATMTAAQFTAMDATFTTAAHDTVSWGAGVALDGETIEDRLVNIVAEHPDAGTRIAALRGFQVAMLRCGWHVGVAYDGFAAYAGEHPGRIVGDEDQRWERLTRWWQPHRGAVCALVALGIPAPDVATLTVGDLTDTTVTTGTGVTDIPRPARLPITAQRLARLAEGATATDPLFVLGDGTDAGTWVRNIVAAAVDAGATIPLPPDGTRQRWHNAREIGRSLGLRTNHLGDLGIDTPLTGAPTGQPSTRSTAAGHEPTALDGVMLGRRRLELGLTQRLLSRRVGVNEAVITALERGELPARMRAVDIAGYATALGLHPAEIFGGLPPRDTTQVAPTEDSAALGALLWTCEEAAPATAICETLHWDVGRVTAAAEHLDDTLRLAGLRLLAGPGEYSIVAEASDVPPRDQVAAIVRRQQLRGSVGLHRVKLLCEIANGTFRGNRNAKANTMAQLRFLSRAELIEYPDGRSTPVLTDDVAFSLMIDEVPEDETGTATG